MAKKQRSFKARQETKAPRRLSQREIVEQTSAVVIQIKQTLQVLLQQVTATKGQTEDQMLTTVAALMHENQELRKKGLEVGKRLDEFQTERQELLKSNLQMRHALWGGSGNPPQRG